MIAGLFMGLAVVLLLVAWRLASGPVSIGFLTPYIQAALDDLHQGAFDITIDDTILTWAGWDRTLDIRVVNVQAKLASGDGAVSIPEVSISLSAQALLKGLIAPRSIEFFGPSLKIQRHADGRFALGFQGVAQGSNAFTDAMLSVMLQTPNPNHAMSYLERIRVVSGELTYEDLALGTTWHAPSANAEIVRVDDGLKAELDMDFQVGEKQASVSVVGTYSPQGKRMDLGVSFKDVTPAAFADLSDQTKVLAALDVPLSGTVTLSVNPNGRIEGFGFDVAGKEGSLALPVSVAADLGVLPWAQRIAISQVALRGRFEEAAQTLDITALSLTPQRGETLYLPAPFDHDMPFQAVKAQLTYAGASGRLNIKDLIISLKNGATVSVDAQVQGLAPKADLSVDLKGTAYNVHYDDLPVLWPKGVAANARTWVLERLSKGILDQASVKVALGSLADGSLGLISLSGTAHTHGLDVEYLPTMPRVVKAKGYATFTQDRIDIQIEGGEIENGLTLTGGDIALKGLRDDMQWADIKLDIKGSVASALQVVDAEPLGFASALGLHPATSEGQVVATVRLRLPLKQDLLATEVEATAQAQLTNAGIQGALFDKNISKGELKLVVNKTGLAVSGRAQLGEIPVEIKWNHDFRPTALFVDHYELSGYIQEVLNLKSLGVDVPDILARYMRGGADVNVNYTVLGDGRQSVSARIDLAKVDLSAPELGWSKPIGVPGTAVLEVRLDQGVPREIPKFSVTAPNMDISGSASFLKNGALERIDFDTMKSGLTNVAGSLMPLPDGAWEVVLRGESLDASLLWDEMIGIGDGAAKGPADSTAREDGLMIHAAVDIRSLLIHNDRVVHDFIGTMYRDRGLWRKIDISGQVGDTGTLTVMLGTAADGLRYLSIASDDAGAALSTLDLYDNILGGVFDLKAAYTRPGKNAPLEGVVKVTDYAMIKAPAFTKLIGVLSLTGILDALQGEGLNFDILNAPFKLEKGVLTLTQTRASGPTIGITVRGSVDMANRMLDLKGTVVPAYAINSLLGKIPLIGKIFRGSEAGGGLFAATYTMTGQGDNVDISVNPLSVLAPGVLRNIFTGSGPTKKIPKGLNGAQ